MNIHMPYNYWCLEWLQKIWLQRVRWTLMVRSTGMNHIPKLPFYLFTHKNFHKLQTSEKFQFEPWPNYKMKVSHKNTENTQDDALGSVCFFFFPLNSPIRHSFSSLDCPLLYCWEFSTFFFFFTPTGRSIVNSFSALIFRLKLPGYLW